MLQSKSLRIIFPGNLLKDTFLKAWQKSQLLTDGQVMLAVPMHNIHWWGLLYISFWVLGRCTSLWNSILAFIECSSKIEYFNFLDSQPMESSAPAAEEKQEEVKKKISINFYYNYLDLVSRPFVTSASLVPLDILTLVYPFQYKPKI